MAQTKNLGKVAVTPRGAYSSGTSYERLDVVTYQGGSWMALQSSTNVTPASGAYWMQIAAKGDDGSSGQSCTVAIGDVTTVPYGTGSSVTNVGTENNAVLDFEIEAGPQGDSYVLTSSDKQEIANLVEDMNIVNVSETDPVIVGVANTRYICGQVATISITPPATGIIDVIFTSGSTVAVVTLPNTVKMPDWYLIETNRVYEINVQDGVYGAVMSWAE